MARPKTPEGLPYIHRNGLLNPDTYELDNLTLKNLMREAGIFALAYERANAIALAQSGRS